MSKVVDLKHGDGVILRWPNSSVRGVFEAIYPSVKDAMRHRGALHGKPEALAYLEKDNGWAVFMVGPAAQRGGFIVEADGLLTDSDGQRVTVERTRKNPASSAGFQRD